MRVNEKLKIELISHRCEEAEQERAGMTHEWNKRLWTLKQI